MVVCDIVCACVISQTDGLYPTLTSLVLGVQTFVVRFLKAVDFYGCQAAKDGGAIYIDYENIEFLPQDATYSSSSIVNNVRERERES